MDISESEVDKICLLSFPEEYKEWINKALGPIAYLARAPELDLDTETTGGIVVENYIVGVNMKGNK